MRFFFTLASYISILKIKKNLLKFTLVLIRSRAGRRISTTRFQIQIRNRNYYSRHTSDDQKLPKIFCQVDSILHAWSKLSLLGCVILSRMSFQFIPLITERKREKEKYIDGENIQEIGEFDRYRFRFLQHFKTLPTCF